MAAATFARNRSAPRPAPPTRFARNPTGEQLEAAKAFIAEVAAGREKMPVGAPAALPQPTAPAGAAAPSPFAPPTAVQGAGRALPKMRAKEPSVTQRMREQLAMLRFEQQAAIAPPASAQTAAQAAPAGQTRHAPATPTTVAPAGATAIESPDPSARLLARMGATADGWAQARGRGARMDADLFAAGLPHWQHATATAALDAYAHRHTGQPVRPAGSPYDAPSLAPAGQAAGAPAPGAWWVPLAWAAGIAVVVGGGAWAVAAMAPDEGHGAKRAFAGHKRARSNPRRRARGRR